jgi:hypothetical protein
MKTGKKISQGHLSSSELLEYSRGSLSPAEQHRLERHLLDCELCTEALKGVGEMNEALRIHEITRELRKKLRPGKNDFPPYGGRFIRISVIAVVFVLLIIIMAMLYFYSIKLQR